MTISSPKFSKTTSGPGSREYQIERVAHVLYLSKFLVPAIPTKAKFTLVSSAGSALRTSCWTTYRTGRIFVRRSQPRSDKTRHFFSQPNQPITFNILRRENWRCGHDESSGSTFADLIKSVSRRCQRTSRHMPRYCGPQKFEVQIAVQRPVADACSTPAAQTSIIQSQSAIGQSLYMMEAQASVVTSGFFVRRDQSAALPIHSVRLASNFDLLAR